jgi:phosphoglucomutase
MIEATSLNFPLKRAAEAGHVLPSTVQNLSLLLSRSHSPVLHAAVKELLDDGAWAELNDRFFKTLAFGTGGLRGRTIGRIVTAAERGALQPLDRPEHACVGTNAMNDFNVSRATQGLLAYLKQWLGGQGVASRPLLVVAHDTRHFSRDFSELIASVATRLGCDSAVFDGPRSTPELSFAVRHLNAHAGIVVTASHNPPHDNGYKVYFGDGAQVVEPHATAIITKVNAIESEAFEPVPEPDRGAIRTLGVEVDEAYMARLESLLLDRPLVEAAAQAGLKIVFTSIHGTGGIISVPMLRRLGFSAITVPEQDVADGRFPTVKSPNPENADALSMGIALAEKEGADLVIATDPDSDRMGVAVRNRGGSLELLTGNQIGSLMAAYRVRKLIEQGVITPETAGRCVLIKTLVTTDLQKAIAERHGLRCVETLTGFKYIGEKLGKYEAATGVSPAEYRALPEAETRRLRLERSSFYVCGGEESYGYSAADFVRDKDANGSVVVFAEVAAYAKSRGITLPELLDEIYAEYGFYLERGGNLTFEGAEGAAQIAKLVASYASQPLREICGTAVTGIRNHAEEDVRDIEGDLLPREKMLVVDLADGSRIAIRPSGTEPKIKFYLFVRRDPALGQRFTTHELAEIKSGTAAALDGLWEWIQKDVAARLA